MVVGRETWIERLVWGGYVADGDGERRVGIYA